LLMVAVPCTLCSSPCLQPGSSFNVFVDPVLAFSLCLRHNEQARTGRKCLSRRPR
jgi:hypothetical protein